MPKTWQEYFFRIYILIIFALKFEFFSCHHPPIKFYSHDVTLQLFEDFTLIRQSSINLTLILLFRSGRHPTKNLYHIKQAGKKQQQSTFNYRFLFSFSTTPLVFFFFEFLWKMPHSPQDQRIEGGLSCSRYLGRACSLGPWSETSHPSRCWWYRGRDWLWRWRWSSRTTSSSIRTRRSNHGLWGRDIFFFGGGRGGWMDLT